MEGIFPKSKGTDIERQEETPLLGDLAFNSLREEDITISGATSNSGMLYCKRLVIKGNVTTSYNTILVEDDFIIEDGATLTLVESAILSRDVPILVSTSKGYETNSKAYHMVALPLWGETAKGGGGVLFLGNYKDNVIVNSESMYQDSLYGSRPGGSFFLRFRVETGKSGPLTKIVTRGRFINKGQIVSDGKDGENRIVTNLQPGTFLPVYNASICSGGGSGGGLVIYGLGEGTFFGSIKARGGNGGFPGPGHPSYGGGIYAGGGRGGHVELYGMGLPEADIDVSGGSGTPEHPLGPQGDGAEGETKLKDLRSGEIQRTGNTPGENNELSRILRGIL